MKATKADGMVILVLTPEEAAHLGRRVDVSSYRTFDSYRDERDISESRHPFAGQLIAELADAGVTI